VATSRRWINVDADIDDVVGDDGTKALAVDDDTARMAAARAAADRRVMLTFALVTFQWSNYDVRMWVDRAMSCTSIRRAVASSWPYACIFWRRQNVSLRFQFSNVVGPARHRRVIFSIICSPPWDTAVFFLASPPSSGQAPRPRTSRRGRFRL